MRRAVIAAGVSLACVVSPMILAQGGNPAAPSAQATPAKSTALILGQVVDGSSGQPLADAVVTLTQLGAGRAGGPPALPAGGASPQAQQAMQAAAAAAAAAVGRGSAGPRRVMTGGDGRFVFHGLPPGQFQLSVTLTGYTPSLNATLPPGLALSMSVMPGLAGMTASTAPVSITLKEGEFATGLKLRLWKTAVVSGVVLDDAGEPAIGLMVQAARRIMAAGRARYAPAASARTDDRGSYRLSSLVPGDYLVVVPQTQVSIPTALMSGIMESVTSGGGMAGLAGGGMALMDVMSSGVNPIEAMAGGVRLGDFMVASSGSVPLVGPDGRLQAYQTVFYPGSGAPAQASVVSLKSGDDRTDVNFQLRLIPTSRVSGTALGPDGPIGNLGIRLVVPGDGSISESEFDVATAVSKSDGTFAFYGVPPGQFLLRAFKQPRPELPPEAMANPTLAAMFGSGGAKGGADTLFATTTVNVAAADIDGLVLQLAAGFRVSGRVEFNSPSGRTQPAAPQMQTVVVTLNAMDGRTPGLPGFSTPDRANAQGEFRTKGYAPGKYFLSVSGPPGWQVHTALAGGRDVLDAPLEIKDGDVTGVVVTFGDPLASITGTVTAPGETDLSETSILVFPANYRGWIDNGMNPRRGRSSRASRAGAYTIANMPPGDYLIAAIDRAYEADLQDPAFVDALSRVATRVTVSTGQATADLTKVRVSR